MVFSNANEDENCAVTSSFRIACSRLRDAGANTVRINAYRQAREDGSF
jgi:hypothetical protein